MRFRLCSLPLLAVALVVFLAAPLAAADDKDRKGDKNTHTGKFVSAKGEREFVMEVKGKEHTHTLAADAKVLDLDGKECHLKDFRKGQMVRVTTREGDLKVATKVEAVRKRK